MNIQKGNVLIAQFMDNWADTGQEPAFYVYKHKGYESHELLFHESWDWLMPVVEKIEELGYYVNILSYTTDGNNKEFGCQITKYDEEDYQYKNLPLKFTFAKSKIEEVYLQIIEFIKWYNKNIK